MSLPDEERFPLRAPVWPLLLGAGVLGVPSIACFREAARMPDFEKASLPLFLGFAFAAPLLIGGLRVSRGERTIVLDRQGVRIESGGQHGVQFAWVSLAPIEIRTAHLGGSIVRAVWLRDETRRLEILEQHVGGKEPFERLVASLRARRDG